MDYVIKIVLFIILLIVGGGLQYVLYSGNDSKIKYNTLFILNVLFAIMFSYVIFILLPTNYTSQRVLSFVWAGLAIASFIIKSLRKDLALIGKITLSIAYVGLVVQFFTKIIWVLFV